MCVYVFIPSGQLGLWRCLPLLVSCTLLAGLVPLPFKLEYSNDWEDENLYNSTILFFFFNVIKFLILYWEKKKW
jgi:hypothetical protein